MKVERIWSHKALLMECGVALAIGLCLLEMKPG